MIHATWLEPAGARGHWEPQWDWEDQEARCTTYCRQRRVSPDPVGPMRPMRLETRARVPRSAIRAAWISSVEHPRVAICHYYKTMMLIATKLPYGTTRAYQHRNIDSFLFSSFFLRFVTRQRCGWWQPQEVVVIRVVFSF